VLTLEVARLAGIGTLSENFSQLIVHLEHLLVVPHLLVRLVIAPVLGVLVNVDASSSQRLLYSPPELGVDLQVGLILLVITLLLAALALVLIIFIVVLGIIRLVTGVDFSTVLVLVHLDGFGCGLLKLLI